MGKSLKNGVSPDEIYRRLRRGHAAAVRDGDGPAGRDRPWETRDVVGMHRFLQRLWRLIVDEATGETLVVSTRPTDDDTARLLHRTIAVVREDFAALRFNTAIARIIELNSAR